MVSYVGTYLFVANQISLFRYLRFVLDLVQYIGFLGLCTSLTNPTLPSSQDVAVISATLGAEKGYSNVVRSWLRCAPKAIIVVTVSSGAKRMKQVLTDINDDRILLHVIDKPDIRKQLLKGIQHATISLLVLVDDDSTWSPNTLSALTSAFTDPTVGGANTAQFVRPRSPPTFTTWESFGALNLIRRNILHAALAYFNSGQVLNLSGRTVAYRAHILQTPEFAEAFLHDRWRGKYPIRTGDDSFITSWIVQRGWKTAFLNNRDAAIITTVNDDRAYLKQVLRWSRDSARHYLRDAQFAVKSGKRDLWIHVCLKWTTNYSTDFAILGEVLYLSAISMSDLFGIGIGDKM